MAYWKVQSQRSKNEGKNIRAAGKKKLKSNMVDCGTATKETFVCLAM